MWGARARLRAHLLDHTVWGLLSLMLFSLMLLSLGLLGCASQPVIQKRATHQASLPGWYLRPPVSDQAHLYGVGEGKSRQEAVAASLSQIASQLQITLSGRVESQVELKHGVETEVGSISRSVEVAPLELRGYELLKQEALTPLRYLVLTRVSRAKLLRDIQEDTERGLQELTRRLAESKGSYQTLEVCATLATELPIWQSRVKSLRSLGRSDTELNLQLNTLKGRCPRGRWPWVVTVVTPLDRSPDTLARDVFVSFLSAGGFQAQAGGATRERALRCALQLSEERSAPMGFKVVRWSVKLELSGEVKRGPTHLIQVVGQSGSSIEHARQVAQQRLREALEEKGLKALIGF